MFLDSFEPFDEGPTIHIEIVASMSNSIDTHNIDPYRQGIELTLDKYFYQGVVKISSGYSDHRLPKLQFGEDDIDISSLAQYKEVTNFDAVNYINAQPISDLFAQPIIVNNFIIDRLLDLNGTIEPLTIRSIINGNQINKLFEPFSIKGNLESGNYSFFQHADQVKSVEKFDLRTDINYSDSFTNISNTPINIGIYSSLSTTLDPFLDTQIENGIIENDLSNQMLLLNPSTDNYVPSGYISNNNGYEWETLSNGHADSLAFGNMTYK